MVWYTYCMPQNNFYLFTDDDESIDYARGEGNISTSSDEDETDEEIEEKLEEEGT